jgi:hypothetical protein
LSRDRQDHLQSQNFSKPLGSNCIQECQRRMEAAPLDGNMQVPDILQKHPKSWFRREAHGSIRIQEGQPVYLRVSGDLAESGQRGR